VHRYLQRRPSVDVKRALDPELIGAEALARGAILFNFRAVQMAQF
jgi:hypothetical protein